jgi:hypothetical protein
MLLVFCKFLPQGGGGGNKLWKSELYLQEMNVKIMEKYKFTKYACGEMYIWMGCHLKFMFIVSILVILMKSEVWIKHDMHLNKIWNSSYLTENTTYLH